MARGAAVRPGPPGVWPEFMRVQRFLPLDVTTDSLSADSTDGAAAYGVASLIVFPIGVAAAGASSQGAASKVVSLTGTSVAGALARGTAAKTVFLAGSSVAGALARGTDIKVAFPASRSVAGSLARGSSLVVLTPPAGSSVAGSSSSGTAAKTAFSRGTSIAGSSANGTAAKTAFSSGTSVAGALTQGIAINSFSPPTPIGSSAIGSSANGTASAKVFPVGVCAAGASSQGISGTPTPPIMVSGTCSGGATAYGPVAQRRNEMDEADLIVGPLMNTIRSCLCEQAARAPNPPAICCFRVGVEIPHDAGINEDQCCEGIGYVALGDTYPSAVSFPEQDIIRQADAKCTFPTWAQVFKLGLIRCVPVGTIYNPIGCDEWNAAAVQNVYDSATLRRVACCIRDYMRQVGGQLLGMSTVVERQIQSTPQGGCVERSMTVTIQIPNCDC